MNDSLNIDFADRRDIRAKLPEARRILAEKEAALKIASDDVSEWRALVDVLNLRAGIVTSEGIEDGRVTAEAETEPELDGLAGAQQAGSSPLDLVVGVVDRESRPIRSRDVASILRSEGIDIDNTTVSNSLHYASHRAKPLRIRKLSARGLYAPFSYVPEDERVHPVITTGIPIARPAYFRPADGPEEDA